MKVTLAQFTDRQLLEALAEKVLLDDPSWVQEQLERQLRDEISTKWLMYAKAHKKLDGNVKVTVGMEFDGSTIDYYNVVIRNVVPVPNIFDYSNEVIAPNVRALVNRIVRSGPELSECEIASIDITSLEE